MSPTKRGVVSESNYPCTDLEVLQNTSKGELRIGYFMKKSALSSVLY